jgi:hypothetical protein
MLSAWLLGSIYLSDQRFDVDASTTGGFVAGGYYLRSATAARSIIDDLATQIVAAVGGTCTITLTRGRTVRIVFNTARTVTWGASTQIRNLLGFTADLGSATTHDAPNVSPLLWSPGYLATPATIEGVDGYTVPHQAIYKSADGSQVYCAHYSTETWQDLSWSHIMPERMRVATGTGGGTFHEFFEQCGLLRARFLYHQEIDELDGSTTSVTYDTARGPYVLRDNFDGDWYRRNVPNAEVSSPLDLPMQQVAEYA